MFFFVSVRPLYYLCDTASPSTCTFIQLLCLPATRVAVSRPGAGSGSGSGKPPTLSSINADTDEVDEERADIEAAKDEKVVAAAQFSSGLTWEDNYGWPPSRIHPGIAAYSLYSMFSIYCISFLFCSVIIYRFGFFALCVCVCLQL